MFDMLLTEPYFDGVVNKQVEIKRIRWNLEFIYESVGEFWMKTFRDIYGGP